MAASDARARANAVLVRVPSRAPLDLWAAHESRDFLAISRPVASDAMRCDAIQSIARGSIAISERRRLQRALREKRSAVSGVDRVVFANRVRSQRKFIRRALRSVQRRAEGERQGSGMRWERSTRKLVSRQSGASRGRTRPASASLSTLCPRNRRDATRRERCNERGAVEWRAEQSRAEERGGEQSGGQDATGKRCDALRFDAMRFEPTALCCTVQCCAVHY